MAFKPKEIDNYLGTGLTLPVRLDRGKWAMDSGVVLVRASIAMILRWMVGTRFFLVEFGSMLDKALEEPNDDILQSLLDVYIRDALKKWEPRIEVLDASFQRTDTSIHLSLFYQVVTSQQTDTYIFPFYTKIDT